MTCQNRGEMIKKHPKSLRNTRFGPRFLRTLARGSLEALLQALFRCQELSPPLLLLLGDQGEATLRGQDAPTSRRFSPLQPPFATGLACKTSSSWTHVIGRAAQVGPRSPTPCLYRGLLEAGLPGLIMKPTRFEADPLHKGTKTNKNKPKPLKTMQKTNKPAPSFVT